MIIQYSIILHIKFSKLTRKMLKVIILSVTLSLTAAFVQNIVENADLNKELPQFAIDCVSKHSTEI